MKYDVIVVGGGAAGIFAAWRAASLGAKVLVIEKTPRLGTKIMVSGGGKCNITHDGPLEQVLRAFRPNEAKFLRPAFYRLLPAHVVDMFTSQGMEVYTRPDGRIFPVSQTAKDVVAILKDHLDRVGVDIWYETSVVGIDTSEGRITSVRYRRRTSAAEPAPVEDSPSGASGGYRPATAKNLLRELGDEANKAEGEVRSLKADRVIVSAGGSSYPNSGTTGDGYSWARELGHRVDWVHAALAPIYLAMDERQASLSGVSLRDVVLKAKKGKEIARWTGDLLFTHQGISGPTALGISRDIEEARKSQDGDVVLEVDLLPDRSFEQVSDQFLNISSASPHRRVANYVGDLVPDRLVGPIMDQAKIAQEVTFGRCDRKSRNRLIEALKSWSLGVVRHVPLEKGEVVAGGIALDEVDQHTMKSSRVEGLWLCGEVLDIAGPVGGYNLQAAFATGFVAGESAAKSLANC